MDVGGLAAEACGFDSSFCHSIFFSFCLGLQRPVILLIWELEPLDDGTADPADWRYTCVA